MPAAARSTPRSRGTATSRPARRTSRWASTTAGARHSTSSSSMPRPGISGPDRLSELHIRPVAAADPAALLRFELEHRAYFERWVNARDPAFYSADGVAAAIAAAQAAWAAGHAFQYLVIGGSRPVGRAN